MARNKYRVSPSGERTFDGRVYASKAEMAYAKHLAVLVDAGEIEAVIEQPRITLGVPENVYRPDFLIIGHADAEHRIYFVDVKGMETAKFKKDKKLWRSYGPLPLLIVKHARGDRFVQTDLIGRGERLITPIAPAGGRE